MFNIHPLYSSSSGNMFHIETNKANILIDVGVSYKAINEGLKSIGKDISDINAVFITHEHIDHIKGLPLLCRKNDIPIYALGKTAKYLEDALNEKNIKNNIFELKYGQAYKIKDIEFSPFETSHDAIMPCGYRLKSGNSTLTFATDLGYVSDNVMENLKEADFAILEANYDNTLLDFGKYPYMLKRRIKSNIGHLSNDNTADAIAELAKFDKKSFLLAHLSENNNNKEIMLNTISDNLYKNDIDFNAMNINVASKNLSSEEYNIC
mgnify:FL=1